MIDFRPQDFIQPDDLSDIILVVQDQKLYAHKVILAEASPVWREMLKNNMATFTQKAAPEFEIQELVLPGKKFDDMLELLKCIYPSVRQKIYERNVMQIVALADEYNMSNLKEECEDLILIKLQRHDSPPRQFMNFLIAAQRHNLSRVMEKAVRHAAKLSLTELENQPEYHEITADTLTQILCRRIKNLENKSTAYSQNVLSWIGKTESLKSELKAIGKEKDAKTKKHLQQKQYLVKSVQDMKNAWELKGIEARCDEDVHRYANFNYNCAACMERIKWYISRKYRDLCRSVLKPQSVSSMTFIQ